MSQLKTNSIVPLNGLPAGASGGIIQVKNLIYKDLFDTNSESPTAVTGFELSINPQSTNSKIFVFSTISAHIIGGGSSTLLYRNGSPLSATFSTQAGSLQGQHSFSGNLSSGNAGVSQGLACEVLSYLDSPASTSTQTYQVYIASQASASTYYVNRAAADSDATSRGRSVSYMTLMEVTG